MTLEEARKLSRGDIIETRDNIQKPTVYEGSYEFLGLNESHDTTIRAKSLHKVRGTRQTMRWFPKRFKSPNTSEKVIKENYNI